MTIGHLVGMVNGFDSGCMGDDERTIEKMRSSSDWVQYALDRKMVREPGTSFCYDSPGMHLLSAVLQEATGLTALEFARQNLFEPLGIQDVIWDSDPQGYTNGWGDLHLKPRDAAKLGYLWLNKGVWDGVQIVSASWVEDAVKPHTSTGRDDYGYGWWVSQDSYYAFGRGGQTIKVVPSFNAIVVTTGSGFEYDEISPYLLAAVIDPAKALPENPERADQLSTALRGLVKSQPSLPVAQLPETARAISGKTFVFKSNPANVETLRLEFDGTNLPGIFCRTAMGTAVIMIIVGASGVMGWLVANMRIGETVVSVVTAITQSPWMILLLMNVFFLIVGCLMDPLAGMLIFIPVFMPLIKHVHIDPVHFGLVVVLNLMIGLLTPPVGYLLFMSAEMAEVSIDAVIREVTPLLIALLAVLVISRPIGPGWSCSS